MLARYASITILALLSQAEARYVWGKCDRPELAQNPVAASYGGLWYEMYRESTTSF
jgi:hypothetical protein